VVSQWRSFSALIPDLPAMLASIVFLLMKYAATWMSIALSGMAMADEVLKQNALGFFRPVSDWQGVAEVSAVAEKREIKAAGEGGILINGATKNSKIPYLITKAEYGDVRVEMEFMVPKESNSGVYLMGRYEVQIFDSFGIEALDFGDLGGIYQCWDDAKPPRETGYGGNAPKHNAAKAPGEWQTLDITFRAPKLDAAGNITTPPLFEKVLVNGQLVQENVSVPAPTRSSPLTGAAVKGPIALQGDHGPIAIRSLRVTSLAPEDLARRKELDAYWARVSKAVNTGDFASYTDTCHPLGVLVSGTKEMSQPLSVALARWEKEFDLTREGKTKNTVDFRFVRRNGDATTAFETGIFRYSLELPGEPPKVEYIRFEALLVKENGAWKILMENQQAAVTEAEWDALK
jgi:hypothetical protein